MEIRRECGYREFAAGEQELRALVAASAWACEDGPRALFDRAVLWLIEHRVLLPGITVLARVVAGSAPVSTSGSTSGSPPRSRRDWLLGTRSRWSCRRVHAGPR